MLETGMNLTDEMQEMTADQAVKMVRELCAQLVNEGTEFHGNVWPGNVELNEEGTAVLGETTDQPAGERSAMQVEYLAPEIFWDNAGEPASDVYALGMLLYTACNGGYLPFQPKGGALTEKDRSSALRKRMKGERVSAPSGVSRELAKVIRKALSYEPENRYQSPAELLSALSETDEALPSPEYDGLAAVGMEAAAAAAELRHAAEEAPVIEEPAAEEAPANAEEETPVTEGEPSADEPVTAGEPAEAASAEAFFEQPKEKRYSVQKDFEHNRDRKASAAPASRKKKKTSPAIPILCVAAVAVIAGVIYYVVSHRPAAGVVTPNEEVSEPYVVIPAESPETTIHPEALEETEATPAPEAEASEEPADNVEEEVITGSATVDGQDVTPVSDTVYVTGAGVNLRTGPGTAYEIYKTINRGTELQRTGTVNGWSQVQYEEGEYYISSNMISTEDPNGEKTLEDIQSGDSTDKTDKETSDTNTTDKNTSSNTSGGSTTGTGSSTTSGSSTSTGTSGGSTSASTSVTVTAERDVIKVTASEVNLRKGPGTGYDVVTTVPAGTELQRTGTANGWNRVVYKGQEVYISGSMTEAVTGSTVSAVVGTLKVTSDVNVRSAANTDSTILGVAKVGTSLPTTGITDGGKWFRVSYNGQEGYVNRKLVSVEDLALVTKDSGTATVTTRANVRSGPGTDYTVLGVVEVDETLTVTGVTDNDWYEVSYDGKVGYIASNLVKK
ncbi:MAG: SH3 domain-containing protein [Oscillospiraceae bacterium]